MTKSKIARADFYRQKRAALLKTIEGVATELKVFNRSDKRMNSVFTENQITYFYNPTSDKIFVLRDVNSGFEFTIDSFIEWYLRKLNNLPPSSSFPSKLDIRRPMMYYSSTTHKWREFKKIVFPTATA